MAGMTRPIATPITRPTPSGMYPPGTGIVIVGGLLMLDGFPIGLDSDLLIFGE